MANAGFLRLGFIHFGTWGPDTLTGTAAAEIVIGDLGDDTLIGNGGADDFKGGPGNDVTIIGHQDRRLSAR